MENGKMIQNMFSDFNGEEIELVIKMPEEIYKHIMSMQFYVPGRQNGKTTLGIILATIRAGTPLPKGHGRLIDADALPLDAIDDANYGSNYIRIAPTIIKADKSEK